VQIKTEKIVGNLVGVGKSSGTFGELLQGMTTNNKDFLVTLPITLNSETTFTSIRDYSDIITFPSSKIKAKTLASRILKKHNLPTGGVLDIKSNIPIGKGLASSSADLVATARAISNTFTLNLSNTELQSLLKDIEPSDGVMYDGIVSFYQKECQLLDQIGSITRLAIVAIDEGSQIDTVRYNKYKTSFYSRAEKLEYECLLESLSNGIRKRDLNLIGKIATKSAILNQKYNYKAYLEEVIFICNQVEGLGVVNTHSGTYLGVLLSQECEYYNEKLEGVYNHLRKIKEDINVFYTM